MPSTCALHWLIWGALKRYELMGRDTSCQVCEVPFTHGKSIVTTLRTHGKASHRSVGWKARSHCAKTVGRADV